MGDGDLRWQRAGERRLPVPPQGLPPSHDALHLHLAVQADPEKARPAGVSKRPLPAAHQRKSAHRKRHGRGHSGGPFGP